MMYMIFVSNIQDDADTTSISNAIVLATSITSIITYNAPFIAIKNSILDIIVRTVIIAAAIIKIGKASCICTTTLAATAIVLNIQPTGNIVSNFIAGIIDTADTTLIACDAPFTTNKNARVIIIATSTTIRMKPDTNVNRC